MSKYNFNKVAMHGCSPVNLMYIFRKLFLKNTSGRRLLSIIFSLLSYQKKETHTVQYIIFGIS